MRVHRDFSSERYNAPMTQASLTRSLKDAIEQTLIENRDSVRDLLAEVMEDVAFAHAIRQGERSKPVKKQAVMNALKRRK